MASIYQNDNNKNKFYDEADGSISVRSGAKPKEINYLDGVSSTVTGSSNNVIDFTKHMLFVTGSGTSSGASVVLQGSPDDSNWVDINTFSVTSDGTQEYQLNDKLYKYLRAKVSSYSDGEYTVKGIHNR